MKTPGKKSARGASEMSLRLRGHSKESKTVAAASQLQEDDDIESDLPIRGRPSKKLLLQQQQQQRAQNYQVKLQPELKTVQAAAGAVSRRSAAADTATAGPSSSGPSNSTKNKRSHAKKVVGTGGAATAKLQGESYVMRLFERSLDLSKYKEKTPLYPICRAWMANQPRNPFVGLYNTEGSEAVVKRDDNAEEVLAKLRSGEMKLLTDMPQARPTEMSIIPPRLEHKNETKLQEGASRELLLAANKKRWKKVRNHWLTHAKKYDHERYEVIDQIVNFLCTKGKARKFP
ncbi:protein lin-37 homolog [Drosophila tropicalis]|uniref:protein lin-37 homolog n=1 Tax=Drosophila tropicalis TaxID=46794 RepID=UPI0035AB96E8